MNNYPTSKSLFDSWLSPKLLAQAEPSFTEPAIRSYIFNADDRQSSQGIIPGNGLGPHIRRLGSKVLINHGGFLSWIDTSAKEGLTRTDRKANRQERASFLKDVGLVRHGAGECPNSKQGRRRGL